ncbi:MAG: hypothetical protein LBU37_10615 [Tannerellaceae bacterium]|jgi:phage repressor protein C with HTH and peptisase S24 domain|nr:hypothetical protein [Tannerellaceae bacterium]
MKTIGDRIFDIMIYYFGEERGNKAKFAKTVNEKPNTVGNWFARGDNIGKDVINKIIATFPNVNSNWLLTGKEPMLNELTTPENKKEYQSTNETSTLYRLVPLINTDAVGGMHRVNDISSDEPEYIKALIPFTEALDGDRCIQITGDSMIPTCPPGSIVQIREVPNWREYFGYGSIFVIQLKDGRRILKEVTRYDSDPGNYVLCVSHNSNVPAEELPKDFILSVWKVIKILTNRGW